MLNRSRQTSVKADGRRVHYRFWKTLFSIALRVFAAWVLAYAGLASHVFLLEVVLMLAAGYMAWSALTMLFNGAFAFHPDKLCHYRRFKTVELPTRYLMVIDPGEKGTVRFLHGSTKNVGESIEVSSWLLSKDDRRFLDDYRRRLRTGISVQSAACVEFEKATLSFRWTKILIAVYLLVYVIVASYLQSRYLVFSGFAPQWPPLLVRGSAIALSALAYGLLTQWSKAPSTYNPNFMARLHDGHSRAFRSAMLCGVVGALGLPVFLTSGDRLDIYLMLAIGALLYRDFYPRLSAWEALAANPVARPAPGAAVIVPRRSVQVSLALIGGLTLATTPADYRIRQTDCTDDQGNPVECSHDGNGSHSSGSSGRSSYGRSSASDERNNVRRGGFGFFGRSHSSFGG